MSKRKVLIIGSSQGVYGGIEAFMLAIAKAASEWPEMEISICFKIVKGYKVNESFAAMLKEFEPKVEIVHRGSVKLWSMIWRADVLHVQNMPPDVVVPAFLMRKKILLTVHNRRLDNRSLHNKIWQRTIRLAHQRWFNSNFVWNSWKPYVKGKECACVPTICELPSKKLVPNSRKGFLFIGRWIPNKGLEEIVQAYSKANIEKRQWPLTILGKGPLENVLFGLIGTLSLTDYVFTPGFVTDEEKESYIARTKWLLAPANTKEDLGLTPIEARAVGVPSIVSRDGGLPEAGGEAALIVEPGDVLDLKEKLEIAVNMDEIEYNRRSRIAEESLDDFLKPLSFYRKEFSA